MIEIRTYRDTDRAAPADRAFLARVIRHGCGVALVSYGRTAAEARARATELLADQERRAAGGKPAVGEGAHADLP